MEEPDLTPMPDRSGLDSVGHYQTADDIDLPPSPEEKGTSTDAVDWSREAPPDPSKSWLPKFAAVALVAAGLLVTSWFAFPPSLEKQHENWQYIAAAAKASGDQLTHVDASNVSSVASSIEVTSSDAARMATRQIRSALLRNDLVTATALLQGAQNMPTASANPKAKPPELVAGASLSNDLKNGKAELYQIELFDCCYEDGDVIEVIVNGNSFATVPITNGGTMVSVPLARGNNTIGIRAVTDGGGGVTVSFRTSRGDYFAQSMSVGTEHQIRVVVQ